MPISFVCPECGKSIKAPDQAAGKRGRCPACKAQVSVPVAEIDTDAGYEIVDEGPASQPNDVPVVSAPSGWQPVRGRERREPSAGLDRGLSSATRSKLSSLRPAKKGRDRLYCLLIVALVPLGFSLLGEEDDLEERIAQTRSHNEDTFQRFADSETATKGDLFKSLPDGRIEGAHLSSNSWMHWVYAALSAALFFAVILLFFRRDSASPASLLLVGLFTGTIGIFLLLGVQLAGMVSQGVWIRGRGVIMLIFYIVKFIGFSYQAALDSDNGFWLSFFGFTFGVGLCEEICKALPVIMEYRRRSAMDWRGACLWGLASGVGFGVSEGITYASDYYNGVSTWGIYVVRFVSCVALHAIWSGSVALLIYRNRAFVQGDMDWSDWFVPLAKCLGAAMILHGLYDTMLKREMNVPALIVAIMSFATLAWLVERTRIEEGAESDRSLVPA